LTIRSFSAFPNYFVFYIIVFVFENVCELLYVYMMVNKCSSFYSYSYSCHGGNHGNGGVEGAKNLRVTEGHHPKLTLATYNGRTLRLYLHLVQFKVELGKIRWHILGLCEVRREGEDTITLESGHLIRCTSARETNPKSRSI
jgi:hypothetical protein